MNLSSIDSIRNIPRAMGLESDKSEKAKGRTGAFDALLQSAMTMLKETDQDIHEAQEAELNFAMGLMTNTHELQAIQAKANISLQFTVAVRNAVMDAYKEIMNIQF